MPRSLRRLILGLLVLAVLAAVSGIALRQSLMRGPLREAAQTRLSAALGQPVTIGSLGVSLFPRIALTGDDIRVGGAERQAPAIQLDRIRMVPTLGSLFSTAIQIDDVQLGGLVISVLRGRDGRWHAPAVAPLPTPAYAGTSVSIARVRIDDGQVRVFDENANGMRETSTIDDIEADVVIDERGLRFSPLGGKIGGAEISGEARADQASVHLEFKAPRVDDASLSAMLALLGTERPDFLRLTESASVSASVRITRATSRLSGTGTLRAPAVALDPLRIRAFEAPFKIDGPQLTFQPTTFSLYGGSHRGTVSIAIDGRTPRWAANSQVSRLDVGSFLDALGGADTRLDGTAQLDASVGGPLGGALDTTMAGRAHIVVADGVVHQFPLLAAINRALRLAEGDSRDTRFERLSATLAIANGRATTNDLVLDARDVRVTAAGTIGFDRTLNLRGRATMSAERTAAAIASVRELSRLGRDGRIELPLTISGTLDDPAFGVDVKGAIATGVKDELLRRLGRIIRR